MYQAHKLRISRARLWASAAVILNLTQLTRIITLVWCSGFCLVMVPFGLIFQGDCIFPQCQWSKPVCYGQMSHTTPLRLLSQQSTVILPVFNHRQQECQISSNEFVIRLQLTFAYDFETRGNRHHTKMPVEMEHFIQSIWLCNRKTLL